MLQPSVEVLKREEHRSVTDNGESHRPFDLALGRFFFFYPRAVGLPLVASGLGAFCLSSMHVFDCFEFPHAIGCG